MTSETISGMTKTILAIALMAACGTTSPGDPHALTACGSAWTGVMIGTRTIAAGAKCELACDAPPMGSGASCAAVWVRAGSATDWHCATTFDAGGATGCCVTSLDDRDPIQFAECK